MSFDLGEITQLSDDTIEDEEISSAFNAVIEHSAFKTATNKLPDASLGALDMGETGKNESVISEFIKELDGELAQKNNEFTELEHLESELDTFSKLDTLDDRADPLSEDEKIANEESDRRQPRRQPNIIDLLAHLMARSPSNKPKQQALIDAAKKRRQKDVNLTPIHTLKDSIAANIKQIQANPAVVKAAADLKEKKHPPQVLNDMLQRELDPTLDGQRLRSVQDQAHIMLHQVNRSIYLAQRQNDVKALKELSKVAKEMQALSTGMPGLGIFNEIQKNLTQQAKEIIAMLRSAIESMKSRVSQSAAGVADVDAVPKNSRSFGM